MKASKTLQPNNDKIKELGLSDLVQAVRVNSIVKIDPEMALRLLRTNKNNRKISRQKIIQYSSAMKAGKWVLNGETIKFNETGELIDGQHRLHAIVYSGVSVPIEICFDAPKDAFQTIDTGKSRNAVDIVSIHQRSDAGVISSALKAVIFWERGLPIGTKCSAIVDVGLSRISNEDIENAYHRHPTISKFIPTNRQIRILGNKPLFTALHYLFDKSDEEYAGYFFTHLYEGEYTDNTNVRRRTPFLVEIEKKISALNANKKNPQSNTYFTASLLLLAWSRWVTRTHEKRKDKILVKWGEQPGIYLKNTNQMVPEWKNE